jgi:hypothetical protein
LVSDTDREVLSAWDLGQIRVLPRLGKFKALAISVSGSMTQSGSTVSPGSYLTDVDKTVLFPEIAGA